MYNLTRGQHCIAFTIYVVFALQGAGTIAASAEVPTTDAVKGIVELALPAIREGGASWIKDNDCLSCHRTSFQVWALNRAQEFGLSTDSEQLDEWNEWATKWQNLVKPDRRKDASMETTLTNENDTIAQLLLSRPKTNANSPDPEWVSIYGEFLLKSQQPDGSWKSGGQLPLQKREKRETKEVTTMWAQIALGESGVAPEDLAASKARASKWMEATTQGASTEWWATRLILAGDDNNREATSALREMLLSFQHDDGGWGWLIEDKSDALGTGIALFALARDGLPFEHDAVRHAVEFLRTTQNEDGTWEVRGTKISGKDSIAETSSYWGATWAVIGLLEFH